MSTDVRWLDAISLRDLVADGEVTPAELADGAIARIAELNPTLNAVAVPMPDAGYAAATDPALPCGPFRGVPFLFKDAGACVAGLPLYMGNGLLRSLDWRAPSDTVLGARFRATGVVAVGKSTLPEFGCQPTSQPLAFGPCRNPWDTTRSTSGSSGGAAAAVAAGLVPVAHASDIGGSIRLPAAWCGVVGLKPSRGRTSSLPITDPNMVEHVITRSVRDTAAFLDAVGGPDPTDVYRLPMPETPYATTVLETPEALRIGFVDAVGGIATPVDPDCVAAVGEAARLLEAAGHHVEAAAPPRLFDEEFALHHLRSSGWEFRQMLDGLANAVGRPLTTADVEPYSWALASVGAGLTDAEYSASQTWQRAYTAELSAWWAGEFDILLTPAAGEPPALLDELLPPPADPLSILPRFERIWCFAAPFSVTGQPAISVPIGRTASGLPVGVQLVAALGREDLLLQLAAQLEAAAPWSDRHPPCTSSDES
ncbi:amidase [Gordonia sp. TBRC 11910]|uniref:amidase n=1 Tax=Gordonia asplenii TaxID=2725283 RepID=A0A848KXD2_9ACTN|nr:amidase [Gordonia asplenii]NMO02989.1 amidase [Gordonia asplenii]